MSLKIYQFFYVAPLDLSRQSFDDFKHNLSNSSVSEVSKMDVTTLYFKTVTRNCNSKIGNHNENENSFFLASIYLLIDSDGHSQ